MRRAPAHATPAGSARTGPATLYENDTEVLVPNLGPESVVIFPKFVWVSITQDFVRLPDEACLIIAFEANCARFLLSSEHSGVIDAKLSFD